MLSVYPACFIKDDDGYSVVFPDLNYLSTCGDTLEESMSMAIDCLAGYLYTAKLDGENVPNPSNISDIDINKLSKELEFKPENCFINLISVDIEAYAKKNLNKSIKKTLTIPEWLNFEAKKKNINFSQTLQDALKEKLGY